MSLADWINRYIVEVRPASSGPAQPPTGAGEPGGGQATVGPARAPTSLGSPGSPAAGGAPGGPSGPRRAVDLLPPAPTAADPDIEALLAEARTTAPAQTLAAGSPVGAPSEVAAPPSGPSPDAPRPPVAAPAPPPAAVSPAAVTPAAVRDPLDDGGDPPARVEQVYAVAKLGRPAHGFTLERIASMLADPRLAQLDERARAGAVAVLLEGAGVTVESIVEDAAARDQALDKFERFLEEKVDKVAADVAAENARLAEEVERLIARKREEMARNEARLVERRRELARFRRVKRAEEARLFEVVRPFTSDNPVTLSLPPAPPPPPMPPAATPAAPTPAAPTTPRAAPAAPAASDPGKADTGVFTVQPRPPAGVAPPADPYEAMAARLRREREEP
ncbi:MAG: hypothetical protein KF878_22770 [Planctomycetes bacterium]|nr:hypothetical protein [Planctomycetota bacterium]